MQGPDVVQASSQQWGSQQIPYSKGQGWSQGKLLPLSLSWAFQQNAR